MAPKTKKMDTVENPTTGTIKAKRGRKSKKELMAALNMVSLVKEKDTENTINLNVSEIETQVTEEPNNAVNTQTTLYEDVLNDEKINSVEDVARVMADYYLQPAELKKRMK